MKSLKESSKETSCSDDMKILKDERDNLKDRYEDSKVYIGELKDKIDLLESKSESKSDDEYTKLKIENNILKHELEITNLKLILNTDTNKV